MKKFLSIAVGVIISTMLGMTVGAAASGNASIVEQLFEAVGVDKTYKNDATELEKLAEDSDLPFENLYLFVYQNVKDGPKDAALKEIASRTGYSKNELEKVIYEGNTGPIVDMYEYQTSQTAQQQAEKEAENAATAAEVEDQLAESDLSDYEEATIRSEYESKIARQEEIESELTQEYLLGEYSYLKNLYDNEYEFQTANKKLTYEALANEMFMNGETDDSAGIDLLYDLNLINTVLFLSDLAYPGRDAGTEDEVELSSEDGDEGGADGGGEGEDLLVVLAAEADETFNNFTCWEDEELRDALDEYDENPPTGSGSGSSGTEAGDAASGAATVSYDDEAAHSEEEVETLEDFNDLLSSLEGPMGSWTRELPCNEIFCIVIDLVTEQDDPAVSNDYEKTDNCIACHVAYINKRMEETLSKSLVPSKVSMNWFEDAVCKAAGLYVNLDLNVYTIPKPIVLDPDNEMADAPQEKADQLAKDLEAFSHSYSDKTQAELDCEALANQAKMAGGRSEIGELAADCESASDAIEARVGEIQDEFIFQSQMDASNTMYDQIAGELKVLYFYFDSLNAALQETVTPLSTLINKKYCGW